MAIRRLAGLDTRRRGASARGFPFDAKARLARVPGLRGGGGRDP